jgi:hypothetical protein
VNANVGALVAAPAQRQELRTEALDKPLRRVPADQRLIGQESEALREFGRQPALAFVAHRAGREADVVDGIGEESAREAQTFAVDFRGEIVHRRRDAQSLAQAIDVERLGLFAEVQGQTALRRLGIFADALVAAAAIGRAAHDAVLRRPVEPAAARQVRRSERRRAAQTQFVGRRIEPRRIRQFEPQNRHAAVGHRLFQPHDIGRLVVARLALQRLDLEILLAENLPADRAQPRRGTHFEACQPRQSVDLHRIVEGQHDLIEISDALALVGRRNGGRARQQRRQLDARALRSKAHALQRLPCVGGAELQGARPQPLPCPGERRFRLDIFFRMIFRPALRRTCVAVKKDRHWIPGAQECLRHDLGAVGALQPVELRRRFGESDGRAEGKGEKESQAFHVAPHFVPDFRPTRSRNCCVTSSGGAVGGGDAPTMAGRASNVSPSAGARASST